MPERRSHNPIVQRLSVRHLSFGVVSAVIGVGLLTACGSGSGSSSSASSPSSSAVEEFNPPGDIPDDQVFVPYAPPGTDFSVEVPEGWSRSTDGGAVTFTDKLNSVRIEPIPAQSAPTIESATSQEVPMIASSATNYAAGDVTAIERKAGTAVLITYEADAAPDPVTDKVVRDAVERYEFWRNGTEAVLTLSGPVGADNVDPWQIISDSFSWK